MSNEIAIRVEGLSKCYEIYCNPRDRLKQFVMPRLQCLAGQAPKQYFREFWALKDVSFEIKKGETVGIIGRNGSGKSTLLQMICGTLNPTSGSIQTNGRIAALLELGSGFNPEFTGRDNVYLNASLLGLSKEEIDQKFQSIVDFADIGEFVEQPVKTYSSGMMVRLAFAVQAQVDPDILIVDEALAVGDAKFQARCFERLKQLKENGTSILLVTHATEQIVTHCSKAVLLNGGVVLETGEPRRVVNRYLDLLFGKGMELAMDISPPVHPTLLPLTKRSGLNLSIENDVFSTRPSYNALEYRWGDGAATLLDFYLAADQDPYPAVIKTKQTITLGISAKFKSTLVRPIFGITIKTKEGVTVYGVNSETLDVDTFQSMGQLGSVVQVEALFDCRLAPGEYFISLGIATKQGEDIVPHDRRYDSIHLVVRSDTMCYGLIDLGLTMTAEEVLV